MAWRTCGLLQKQRLLPSKSEEINVSNPRLVAVVVDGDVAQQFAHFGEVGEEDALLDLVLVPVLPVGLHGCLVDPPRADLDQLDDERAHLRALGEEGAVRVGRERDPGVVDLQTKIMCFIWFESW